MHPSHFVLGAWSEEIQSFPRHPPMSDFVRDGSYLAFRWIYQDVARFNRYLRENATRLAPQLASAEA